MAKEALVEFFITSAVSDARKTRAGFDVAEEEANAKRKVDQIIDEEGT